MIKYCCPQFKEYYKEKPLRGFNIILNDRKTAFRIKFLSIEVNQIDRLSSFVKETDLSFNIYADGDLGIRFCPWCGTNLKELIKEDQNT